MAVYYLQNKSYRGHLPPLYAEKITQVLLTEICQRLQYKSLQNIHDKTNILLRNFPDDKS